MKLSLSGRIAEEESVKNRTAIAFVDLAQLASEIGYRALCLRPSQVTTETPDDQVLQMRSILDQYGLKASMVCLHPSIAANAPDAGQPLRDFQRDLDVGQMLGARLIRIGIKTPEDVTWAQRAADQARERGISLVHQTHANGPFETIAECLEMVSRVGRPNFGLTVEPANLLLCGQDYGPEAMRRLGPHVFNVYLQNLRLVEGRGLSIKTNRGVMRYERLIIGDEGGIDFAYFFEGLRTIAYDGFVTIHQPLVPGFSVPELAHYVFERLGRFIACSNEQSEG